MKMTTTTLNAQVDSRQLRKAERIWARHGMKRDDAINIFLAQTIVRGNFPIVIGSDGDSGTLCSAEEQLSAWDDAFGEY